MQLPPELEQSFWQDFQQFEEEKHMPFVTSVERLGIEKGRKEGLVEAIALDLEMRFPEQAAAFVEQIRAINSVDTLRVLLKAAKTAPSSAAFEQMLRETETSKNVS